jgi:hypothetical protein
MRLFIVFMLAIVGVCGYFVGDLQWGPSGGVATGIGAIIGTLLIVWVLLAIAGPLNLRD